MKTTSYLRPLGVYGYDAVEPVILAALLTADPLLLIGLHGTGKTFLLNSLSEALGLEHRHYNASLIAFDDLVGFPFPDQDGTSIRYLPTPATVWSAESILIDEINRCRPEHQNRLFSLIQERRVQGLSLERLRYRWAAMNPPGLEHGYHGTEPLDPALADRFAFIVQVADWPELNEHDQRSIADPRGDGLVSTDGGRLRSHLAAAQERFTAALAEPPSLALDYACAAATALQDAGLRLSPRRVRQLARNLIAITLVSARPTEALYRLALENSVPQVASGETPPHESIAAAHRLAWDAVALTGRERWLHEFAQTRDLAEKVRRLLRDCPDPDTGNVAVAQFLASEAPARRLALVLALTPRLLAISTAPVGADGLQDLSAALAKILHQNGVVGFAGKPPSADSPHYPGNLRSTWVGTLQGYDQVTTMLDRLPVPQRATAAQYIDAVIQEVQHVPPDATELVHECLRLISLVETEHR